VRPAWNFVGNPFDFPVPVENLWAIDPGTPAIPPRRFQITASANPFTEHVVKGWDPRTSSYVNVSVLNAGAAYWVRNLARDLGRLYLEVYPSVIPTPGTASERLACKPGGVDWAVTVVGREGDRLTEPIMLGAASVKAGEWNSLCLGRAPDPPGPHVSLYLPKPDWGRMCGDYVREFQPQAETMTWEFVAQAAEVPGEVALDFGAFALPAGVTLWLTDLQDRWTREVRAGDSVTFPATADARRFRLVATTAGGQQTATLPANALRYAYPNPF